MSDFRQALDEKTALDYLKWYEDWRLQRDIETIETKPKENNHEQRASTNY